MLHTLQTGTIASKAAAARWAQSQVDPQWRDLLQRACDERPNPSLRSRQTADPDDVTSTLAFINYAVVIADSLPT